MVFMEKGNAKKFVPDVLVSKYVKDGYSIVGAKTDPEVAEEAAPVEEKPKRTRKPKAE